jgi:hypothetical protein
MSMSSLDRPLSAVAQFLSAGKQRLEVAVEWSQCAFINHLTIVAFTSNRGEAERKRIVSGWCQRRVMTFSSVPNSVSTFSPSVRTLILDDDLQVRVDDKRYEQIRS